MKFHYDLYNNGPIIRKLPVFGAAANLEEGAAVMRGATVGTNGGFVILATGALTDIIGVMAEQHVNTVSGDDSNTTGTNYTRKKVIINPFAVYLAEYFLTDNMDVLSTSGTTVTITSLENLLDRGWLYATTGTGIGRLALITTSAAGSVTTKETTGWDSTTKVIKILPPFHQLIKIADAGRGIGSDPAAATGEVTVWENYIEATSIPFQPLNNKVHSGLTGLNDRAVKFFSDIQFRDHVGNTLN